MLKKKVIFISTMGEWVASEELWWRTAVQLAKQGFLVSASVVESSPPHRRVQDLKAAGIHVQSRPTRYSLWTRAWHYIFGRGKTKVVLEVEKLLQAEPPKLVVLSSGFPYLPVELMELCVSKKLPFVTIVNGNDAYSWPNDVIADRYRNAAALARRCYFVSNATLRLTEKQVGFELPNAEVVWSQFNVGFNSSSAWPTSELEGELRLACVGRLYPAQKGQDILLEALASLVWTDRRWHLSFYGEGPMRNSLERLTARLGLSNHVTFAGYVAVEEIWSANHVLVMPSRSEGLPLAIVEAMLCGRPVLATDVGGNSEIVIDGVTGFLAEAPTVAAVAQGLERLWANRANLENMGRAGAKRIRELVPADPIRVFSEKIEHLMD
jgi:glycosyltransferase involved in cell wall biosynthesis